VSTVIVVELFETVWACVASKREHLSLSEMEVRFQKVITSDRD